MSVRRLPRASVIRSGRSPVPTERVRERAAGWLERYGPRLQSFAAVAVGLWPLWAVVLLWLGMLWAVGYYNP